MPVDPTAVPPSGAVSAPASRRPRDMALSLVALLVPIAIMAGVYRLAQGGDRPITVDVAAVFAQVRAAGDFPAAEPRRLPDDWAPISANYAPGDGQAMLRVGYVGPSGAGYQLIESDRPADQLLAAELGATRPAGPVVIDGRPWQQYPGRAGETALALLTPERTVLVIGTGPAAELRSLAASLG
ncbi:DUF4245 domain-containing protein [Pilimelia columellifera]|uniref:DUF4245 domain-containing protein n=1 Tax=Pilimelia columellifera subsp. columellifera TaxID=706583 RepID=A0ABP6AHC9_9ACTN